MKIVNPLILSTIVVGTLGFVPSVDGQKSPVLPDTKLKTTYHDEKVTIEVAQPLFPTVTRPFIWPLLESDSAVSSAQNHIT